MDPVQSDGENANSQDETDLYSIISGLTSVEKIGSRRGGGLVESGGPTSIREDEARARMERRERIFSTTLTSPAANPGRRSKVDYRRAERFERTPVAVPRGWDRCLRYAEFWGLSSRSGMTESG